MKVLTLLGIITGSAINVTANVAGTVARSGVDITEGTMHSVGNILTGENSKETSSNVERVSTSIQNKLRDLDNTLNMSTIGKDTHKTANPDTSESPIQKPIAQDKSAWCLVGEYKGSRGCIEVSEYDKCMSGQVYPSQKMCLNPTLSTNAVAPDRKSN